MFFFLSIVFCLFQLKRNINKKEQKASPRVGGWGVQVVLQGKGMGPQSSPLGALEMLYEGQGAIFYSGPYVLHA